MQTKNLGWSWTGSLNTIAWTVREMVDPHCWICSLLSTGSSLKTGKNWSPPNRTLGFWVSIWSYHCEWFPFLLVKSTMCHHRFFKCCQTHTHIYICIYITLKYVYNLYIQWKRKNQKCLKGTTSPILEVVSILHSLAPKLGTETSLAWHCMRRLPVKRLEIGTEWEKYWIMEITGVRYNMDLGDIGTR